MRNSQFCLMKWLRKNTKQVKLKIDRKYYHTIIWTSQVDDDEDDLEVRVRTKDNDASF